MLLFITYVYTLFLSRTYIGPNGFVFKYCWQFFSNFSLSLFYCVQHRLFFALSEREHGPFYRDCRN